MAETAEEPVQPTQQHKASCVVLKASIHCEGCKRKVKKILNQVQGVESVEVDTKQQKVTVTGTVDADTLIKKLTKSGKHAQLWPQNPAKLDTTPRNVVVTNKEKKIAESKSKIDPTSDNIPKDSHRPPVPTKLVQAPAKHINGVGVNGVTAEGSSEASEVATSHASTKTAVSAGSVEETKQEDKKKDGGEPPHTAGKKEAMEKSNGGEGSSTSGKKKKKKGQSGNHSTNSAAAEPAAAAENRVPPTNQIPPYNPPYPGPHYYHTDPFGADTMVPPPTQAAYAVSYNTAYPTSSYTTAYYTAQPSNSYAYMHPQTPTDVELNIPRQPLDSFEIFSDENPNGCFVM